MATVVAEADVDYDLDCEPVDGAEGEYQNGSARRPMNAFLIFCKRHRSLVREKYPHLENRSVTKILGELWANLDSVEKVTYTELAKQYKEAFMKANPDFKWYKLPSSVPLRSPPNTRPTNQRITTTTVQQLGVPLNSGSNHQYNNNNNNSGGGGLGVKLDVLVGSSSSSSASASSFSPPSMAAVATNPYPAPTMPLFKLADEAQMGGLSSLINPTKAPPSTMCLPATAVVTTTSTPTPSNLISKPPKKRYLENGAFRSQPVEAPQNTIPSSSSFITSGAPAVKVVGPLLQPTPVPHPSATSSADASSSSSAPSSSASAVTSNDCSALLKLAEMCSHELVRGGPVPNTINNANAKGIVVNGGTMGGGSANASTLMTSGTPGGNSPHGSQQPSSNTDYGLTDFGKLMANAMRANLAASGCRTASLNLFSSGQDFGRAGGGGAVSGGGGGGAGSGGSGPPSNKMAAEDQPLDLCTEKTITTSHQELIDCIVDTLCRDDDKKAPYMSARLQGFRDGAVVLNKGRGGGGGIGSGGGSNGGGGGQCRSSSRDNQGGDRSALSLPLKKSKGIRDSSRCSPGGESGGAFSEADDGPSPRKPQRSCKGKRYQAMLSEGILQSTKERKLGATITRKPSIGGDDEMMSTSAGGTDMNSASSPTGGPPSRTRTPSDSSESTASRRSDREDSMQHTSNRSELMDDSPVMSSSEMRTSADSAMAVAADREHQRKRFKTGDFDLDVHIAALPECNIDALKCKKQKRQGSSSPAGCALSGRRGTSREDGSSDSMRGSSGDEGGINEASQSDDSGDASVHSSSESRGGSSGNAVLSKKHHARKRYTSASNSSTVDAGVVDNFKLVALAEVCEEQMSSGNHQQQHHHQHQQQQQQQHQNLQDPAIGSA